MSRFVLDDQLDLEEIVPRLVGWISFVRLQDLRPGEHILDDRVTEILLTLKQPTFLTIDHGFWHLKWCHRKHCVIQFDLADNEQSELPGQLRRLLQLPEFQTRKARMGKVARVQSNRVTSWEAREKKTLDLP